MRRRSALWTSRVAAFLAVALLAFAGVKSPVMQLQMALGATADCGMTSAQMAYMGGQMQADPFAAPLAEGSDAQAREDRRRNLPLLRRCGSCAADRLCRADPAARGRSVHSPQRRARRSAPAPRRSFRPRPAGRLPFS